MTIAAFNDIGARQISDDVVARTTLDVVRTVTALDPIVARATPDRVVADATDHRVGTCATADHHVIAARVLEEERSLRDRDGRRRKVRVTDDEIEEGLLGLRIRQDLIFFARYLEVMMRGREDAGRHGTISELTQVRVSHRERREGVGLES